MTYYIFFFSYTALCFSHLRLLLISCRLTFDSSWDSSIHGFSESCGLTFSCLYRLYITELHGQCLLLFGWECDLNKCEICCGFKQGTSQKEGRLEILEMSARVGFWVLIGGYSYMPLFNPVYESTKKPRTSAVKLLYSPLWWRGNLEMCHVFVPHKFSTQHSSYKPMHCCTYFAGVRWQD